MSHSTLTFIIISFTTAKLTVQAVLSVINEINNTPTLKNSAQIMVVDNNSSDDSVTQLKQLQTNCSFLTVITNKKNLGFGQANNLAIQASSSDYVLLLNSDTQLKPKALAHLMQSFAQNPIDNSTAMLASQSGKLDKLGILAASLLNPDLTEQRQGGALPTLMTLASTLFFLDDIPLIGKLFPAVQETGRSQMGRGQNGQLEQKGWVAGTTMCVKKEVFNEVGLFDKNIFMYGEDIEFCLRAKNHHFDIAIDPQAKIIHYGSASSNQEQAILGEIKAYLYIWAKHKPHWQLYFVKMMLYLAIKLRIIIFGWVLNNKTKLSTYKKAQQLIS